MRKASGTIVLFTWQRGVLRLVLIVSRWSPMSILFRHATVTEAEGRQFRYCALTTHVQIQSCACNQLFPREMASVSLLGTSDVDG